MEQTYNELIRTVTVDYLGGIDMDSDPSPETIENELLQATNNAIQEYNLGPRDENAPIGAKLKDAYPDQKPPGERLRKLKELLPFQIALAIKEVHHAKLICWAADEGDGNYDVGVYQSEGDAKGVYDTRSDNLTRLIRRYDATISKRNVDEVVAILRAVCEVVSPCTKPDLVAVNNGLYDYGNKILMDFDPTLVFTSKIGTDFVEDAPNPVIHNNEDGTDWDVVTWMDELSDDPEVVELLWQVLGAATTARGRFAPSPATSAARGRGRPSPSRRSGTTSSSNLSRASPPSSPTRTTRAPTWTMRRRSSPSSRETRS